MGNDGVISVGQWGGPGGSEWSFKPKNGITKIEISYKQAICVRFYSYDESSDVYGIKINEAIRKMIHIDHPSEYLIGITGTYQDWYFMKPPQPTVIKSLCFYTNTSKYGVFGSEIGTPFSFRTEGGQIVGFHGRSGHVLDTIGVYIKLNIYYMSKLTLVYSEKHENFGRELQSARLQLATLKTKHENVGRELQSARLQLATLKTKVNRLMKIIIVSFTGLVFWFLMKMWPSIWSFSILVTMLGVKMINKVVSDAVDGWVLNISVYICTYLISKIFWS